MRPLSAIFSNTNRLAMEDADFLQQMLRNAENDSSIMVYAVEAVPCCKNGENYMSLVTRVKISGSQDGKQREWCVVVKRQPTSKARREMFRSGPVFRNEMAVYYKVLPAFRRRFPGCILPFPAFHHADYQLRDDIIVLEDLALQGFTMRNRLQGLDVEHCRMVFKGLAQFHAISLAFKRLHPAEFRNVKNSIDEVVYIPEARKFFKLSMENSMKMATASLRILSNNDGTFDNAIRALEGLVSRDLFETMTELVAAEEPWATICLGDCWNNNMLFKYSERGHVEEVKFLDLQLGRYASPVTDLLHFTYTSTTSDIRKRHLQDLLDLYHATLMQTMNQLLPDAPRDAQADIIASRSAFQKEFTRRVLYGLLNAIFILPAVLADPDRIVDLETLQEADFMSQKTVNLWISQQTPIYRETIKDLVLEFIDNKCLCLLAPVQETNEQ